MSSRINGRQTPSRVNYAGQRARVGKGSYKKFEAPKGIFNEDRVAKQAAAEGKRLGNMYADSKAASEAAKKAAEAAREKMLMEELANAGVKEAKEAGALVSEPLQEKTSFGKRLSNWFKNLFKESKNKREIKKALDSVMKKEQADAARMADAYQSAVNAGFERNLANISAKESAAAYIQHGLTNAEKSLNAVEGAEAVKKTGSYYKNLIEQTGAKTTTLKTSAIEALNGINKVPNSAEESAAAFIEHGLTGTEKKLNLMDKVSGFFKGKGGKAALIGLGIAAVGAAAYFIIKGIKKHNEEKAEDGNQKPVVPPVAPSDSTSVAPSDTTAIVPPVAPSDSTNVTPNDSTSVVPPVMPNDSTRVTPDPVKPVEPGKEEKPVEPVKPETVYTVKNGDKGTWGIAQKLLTKKNGGVKPSDADVLKLSKQIRKLNNLHLESDNYTVLIYPNQQLILPDEYKDIEI